MSIQIAKTSFFKNPEADKKWFLNWVKELETLNGRSYESLELETDLGKTQVWGVNTEKTELEPLVIFPGARTTALFWDMDNALSFLENRFRIYLVETNGLQNLSDGSTPDIKGLGYGTWAAQVLSGLRIESAVIAGASFGGLICMKLGITNPEMVKKTFLFNPGCLQPFSMKWTNLYYNLLPIISPKPANVSNFLDKAVFCKPTHQVSSDYEQLIIDYEVFALTRYKDNTQKPYFMRHQLKESKVETYLFLGNKDLLFPFQKSMENARKLIPTLKTVEVFPNVAHGIETYQPAIKRMLELV